MADDHNCDDVFELRTYAVAPGRGLDMRRRVQSDLAWLFPRHGIRPAACWLALSGPDLPLFVYLTPFASMAQRDQCWRGFYADPDWQEVRNRTNAGSELVETFQSQFLRPLSPWQDAQPGAAVQEMVVQRTLVGKSAAAALALRDSELPALQRAGAQVLGLFEMISGGPLPSAVTFLSWGDWANRRASDGAVQTDPERLVHREAERDAFGHTLVGRAAACLLDPVAVDWA